MYGFASSLTRSIVKVFALVYPVLSATAAPTSGSSHQATTAYAASMFWAPLGNAHHDVWKIPPSQATPR